MADDTRDPRKFAIPTLYRGVQFRSRLEARYAALFDLLKWEWQYEFADLDRYLPDYGLFFPAGIIAVEVKAAQSGAELMPHARKMRDSGWKGEYLILGARPLTETSWWPFVSLGVYGQKLDAPPGEHGWVDDHALVHRCRQCHAVSFHHASNDFRCVVNGCYDGDRHVELIERDEVLSWWRAAGNAVMWNHPGPERPGFSDDLYDHDREDT